MYGGFTSNVDMKSGAPAFGTPEYAQAAQASGQLARLIGVPFRSSNVTAANDVDAQAAYESMMSLWGCDHGRRPSHPACGGLARRRPHRVVREAHPRCRDAADDGGLLRAVRRSTPRRWRSMRSAKSGPAGHYFGTAHTLARYETAFYTPLLSNWDNYDTWIERGAIDARRSAPTASGSSCSRNMSSRRSIRPSTRRSRTMSRGASAKAGRR